VGRERGRRARSTTRQICIPSCLQPRARFERMPLWCEEGTKPVSRVTSPKRRFNKGAHAWSQPPPPPPLLLFGVR
jgi:hypothetical protein